MFRTAISRRLICTAFFPFTWPSEQNSNKEVTKVSESKVIMDKIKDALYDQKGYPTKEFQSVMNTTFAGFVTGVIVGGLARGKDVPAKFKAENQATVYQHKYYAQKALQYNVVMAVIKGGASAGAKFATFCFLFSGISTALYVYRRQFDVLNHTCSGALTGLLFRMNMGLKGAFAGTMLGSILGSFYGTVAVTLLYITGTEVDSLYESSSKLMNARRDKIRENSKLMMAAEELEIRQMYEKNKEFDQTS